MAVTGDSAAQEAIRLVSAVDQAPRWWTLYANTRVELLGHCGLAAIDLYSAPFRHQIPAGFGGRGQDPAGTRLTWTGTSWPPLLFAADHPEPAAICRRLLARIFTLASPAMPTRMPQNGFIAIVAMSCRPGSTVPRVFVAGGR